ncbi:discoidin domain-containing protein, partial [Micromonospora sp. NPDC051296]|uniref:galactose-binding domain-containing protein n=1 Tax=Micromonospora sp. NPDC051296 TaxID=3155046 RepID=UPI00341A7215
MALTRRTLIGSIAAGSALAATGDLVPTAARPAHAASPPGDVVGKITVGYQGWFSCPGDGAPIGGWWHWSRDRFQPPSPSNTTIVSWPDLREYAHGYPTAYPNLGNGQPATLFSSYDQQTVDTHFRWMQEHGCDTAALQRFNPFGDEGPTRDAMAVKVRGAAERFGRKFYLMYDVTGWTSMQSQIKPDWTTKMSAHTASPAYARQNGKPVVCIWGFGFNDDGRPFAPAPCLDVVQWFKAQGCYVIGGVPTYWRQGINDSRPGFSDVYHAFHMLSPWMVGRTGTLDGLDWFHANVNVPDLADCTAYGIDYQPCVMPGDLSAGHRRHGDFYWRHLYNMIRLGAQGLYVSMFDEFNEGNQIAKTSETQAGTPAGAGIRALDEDGTFCSADYYLRITADGGRMLKGQLALTPVRPTPPVVGGGPPPTGNLAAGRPAAASSQNGPFTAGNAVDGDRNSYWEATNNAFPQWWQVDLGAAYPVNRLVLALPAGWEARTQTLSVQGSTDGAAFTTLAAPAAIRFDPATGNTATVTVPTTTARHIRVTVTGNTAWPAAQLAHVEVYATTGTPDPPPQVDLARGRPTAESSHVQNYGSGNVVDGNPDSYWESANNAFPQWVQVDLGTATAIGRVVLRLPPSAAWQTRTQTLSIQGSTDGAAWSTLVASAGRVFDPATGNQVTLTLSAAPTRYVRVRFTGVTDFHTPRARFAPLLVTRSPD